MVFPMKVPSFLNQFFDNAPAAMLYTVLTKFCAKSLGLSGFFVLVRQSRQSNGLAACSKVVNQALIAFFRRSSSEISLAMYNRCRPIGTQTSLKQTSVVCTTFNHDTQYAFLLPTFSFKILATDIARSMKLKLNRGMLK